MSPARAKLMSLLEKADTHGRLRVYTPVTKGGEDIYVHSKITIVDDAMIRVGSANINNRSMGLDSECDLLVDGTARPEVRETIGSLRTDLIAEHLGLEPDEVADCFAETKSLIACIEQLRGSGRTLVPLVPEAPNALERKMARSEILDPEGPDELFERRARPGLLSRLGSRRF